MKKTAFLCLALAAVLYFAGSFWKPLTSGRPGIPGCASARKWQDQRGMSEDIGTSARGEETGAD